MALYLLQGHVEVLSEVQALGRLHAAEVQVRALLGGDGLDHLLGGGVGPDRGGTWANSAAWLLYLFGTLELVHEGRLTVTLHLLVGARPAHLILGLTHHHARRASQVLLRRKLRILLQELLPIVHVDRMVYIYRRLRMWHIHHRRLLAILWQLSV